MTRHLLFSSLCCLLSTACGPGWDEGQPEESTTPVTQDLTLGPVTRLPSAPTVLSLTPALGLAGTVVTINGTNFINLAPTSLASIYRFENSASALQVTVVSDTQARFTVPATAQGGRVCRSSVLSSTPTSCTSNAFVVGDPNGRVRLENRTRVDLISARLNGVEVLAPQTVAGGTGRDVSPVAPGNASWRVDVGFGPFAGPAAHRVVCSTAGSLSVQANATTPLWIADLTVADLLSHCSTANYVANYLDDAGQPRQVTIRFEAPGNRWVFLEGNTVLGSGPVSIVAWNTGSAFVTFRLVGTGWPDITIGYPYAVFSAGPAGQTLGFARTSAW